MSSSFLYRNRIATSSSTRGNYNSPHILFGQSRSVSQLVHEPFKLETKDDNVLPVLVTLSESSVAASE